MNVVETFGYVMLRSARNRVVAQVKRLKQPRYLLATLLGLAYWYFYFGRTVTDARALPRMPGEYANPAAAGFTVLGVLALLTAWIFGARQSTLAFSEAEIQFFFPAPVTRRALLNYKLLKSMLVGLFTTAFFTLFFGRAAQGSQWFFVVGFWLALSTYSFHSIAAGRTRQLLAEQGKAGWLASVPTLLVVLLYLGGLAWAVVKTGPLPPFAPKKEWFDSVLLVLEVPPLSWALWPIGAFARVIFAPDVPAFVLALPAALAVLGLHYLWVMAGDVSFEEASVRAAEARAKLLEARREGRTSAMPRAEKRKPPFALSPRGPPEVALIWKGAIAAGRLFNARLLLVLALTIVPTAAIMGALAGASFGAAMAAMMLLMFWAMTALFGSSFSKSDLRRDLEYVDVLRSLPMSGRQIVLGEALGGLAPAVVVQWFLLAVGLALAPSEGELLPLELEEKLAFGIALAVAGPCVTLAGILVQNAAVIFVPAWVPNPRQGPQGPEAAGMGLLIFLGMLLGISLGLLPAFLFGALVGFAVLPLLGLWSVIAAAVAFAGAAAVEAWTAAALLGIAFERAEPGV